MPASLSTSPSKWGCLVKAKNDMADSIPCNGAVLAFGAAPSPATLVAAGTICASEFKESYKSCVRGD